MNASRGFLRCLALLATGLSLGRPSDVPTFRSGANLVVLDVQVLYGSEPLGSLEPSDFHITDDGRDRPIELFEYGSAPLDLTFALDTSEGVSRTSAPEWHPSLRRALSNIRRGDRVGVVTFGADAVVHTRLTMDESVWDDAIDRAIERRHERRSRPNIYGALLTASTLFDEPRSFRRRVVLLVTHNMGAVDRDAAQIVAKRYSSVGITLQMVVVPTHEVPSQRRWGFGSVLNRRPNRDPMPPVVISEKQKPTAKLGAALSDLRTADSIADATGGEVFRYRDAYEPDRLGEVMMRLRNRYLIGFKVPDKEYVEGWHRINVHLSPTARKKYPAGLQICASRAYYGVAPSDSK